MIKKLLPSFALLSVVLMYGCSSGRLAQQDQNDDVYYSAASAREVPEPEPQVTEYRNESEAYQEQEAYRDQEGEYYEEEYASDDYSARIRRFYRYSPWRGYYDYYDPWDPFYYSYHRYPYYRPGIRFSISYGHPFFYDPYMYGFGYAYAGYPYYRYGYGYYGYGYNPWGYNRWGLYSYYNSYPGYGLGRTYYASPNYRPRPSRDFDNTYGSPVRPGGRGSVRPDGRTADTRTRAERYGDGRTSGSGEIRGTRPAATSARPSRTDVSRPSRSSGTPARSSAPSRSESGSSRPTRTERYTPPPAPASTSQRSSGSSSSSSPSRSSSGSSSGRPSRGN